MTTSTRKAKETAQSLIRFEDSSGIGRAAGGTTGGELYITTSGSLSSSLDTHVFGSCSAGWKPIGVKVAEDGSGDYALKVDTELVLSGNITVTNIKGYSTDDGTSGSLVYGKAASDGTVFVTSSDFQYLEETLVDELQLLSSSLSSSNALLVDIVANTNAEIDLLKLHSLYSYFKYQIGVDQGTYDNGAGTTTINLYGISSLSGSTVCPWVQNTTDGTLHLINLPTVTTSSLTVSPALTTASASLIIKFNAPEQGFNPAPAAYDVWVGNPDYTHYTGPSIFVSESNGAMGLMTSSDIPCVNYDYITLSGRLMAVTCSLSATLSTESPVNPADWYPITNDLTASTEPYGTGSFIMNINNIPTKYTQIRFNYWKVAAENVTVARIALH